MLSRVNLASASRTSTSFSNTLLRYVKNSFSGLHDGVINIGYWQVMHNLVNYKSFGFTKIVPRVAESEFAKVVAASSNASNAVPLFNEVSHTIFSDADLLMTFTKLKEHIYSVTPETSLFIGKRSEGHVSNYYLGEVISDEEVAQVQEAAEKLGVDILNTR
jgi:dipeptidyl-peptidase-3